MLPLSGDRFIELLQEVLSITLLGMLGMGHWKDMLAGHAGV